ncbi:MAG: DUF4861 domain-containing protein, partial [Sphingobacteriales bacterium]
MRKMIYKLVAAIVLSIPFAAAGQSFTIRLKNTLLTERRDELVVLSKRFLDNKAGSVIKGNFSMIDAKGVELPYQLDDLDGDSKWDEAALLISFKPAEVITLKIIIGKAPKNYITKRAHVRQRRKGNNNGFGQLLNRDSVPAGQPNTDFSKQQFSPFLTEGPAWENDKVGFRIYMDVRNTKDIWGKTTNAMILDTVGVIPGSNYHHLDAWGMDILAVGKSLGAGSLALIVPFNGKDTLLRLGGTAMGPVIYEKVADGPLRAIFKMHYPRWQALRGLSPISVTEEISISGGQYFYQSKVSIKNTPSGAALAVGLVNLKALPLQHLYGSNARILYTYGRQSENNNGLVMAIGVAGAK